LTLEEASSERTRRLLEALNTWHAGCDALRKRRGAAALASFDDALRKVPEGKIYELSRWLALAMLGRWHEVDRGLSVAYPDWEADPRFGIVQAMLGMARPDLESAESWFREPAEKIAGEFGDEVPDSVIRRLWADELDRDVIADLRRAAGAEWQPLVHQAAIAEEYYFVLLWRGAFAEAERYASRMVERLEFLAAPKARWLERAGNAAFFLRDFSGAEVHYRRCLEDDANSPGCLLKLSDVSFVRGDLDGEQRYRQRIYGTLGTLGSLRHRPLL
jgi:hypothetical protein